MIADPPPAPLSAGTCSAECTAEERRARTADPIAYSVPFEPAARNGTSVIVTDLTILGQGINIISKDRLRIDDDIYTDAVAIQLIISADGSVIGTVSAEWVDVHGGVKGTCSPSGPTGQRRLPPASQSLRSELRVDALQQRRQKGGTKRADGGRVCLKKTL